MSLAFIDPKAQQKLVSLLDALDVLQDSRDEKEAGWCADVSITVSMGERTLEEAQDAVLGALRALGIECRLTTQALLQREP